MPGPRVLRVHLGAGCAGEVSSQLPSPKSTYSRSSDMGAPRAQAQGSAAEGSAERRVEQAPVSRPPPRASVAEGEPSDGQRVGAGRRPVPSPAPSQQAPAPWQRLSETPPATPALLEKPGWSYKLDRRSRCTATLQRVIRGHFVRRVWVKPIQELQQWRKYVQRQPASARRPMLVHIEATNRQDDGWLGEARRAHLLVPIGCPDTVKWFPTTKAIKNWWYTVPDKIRRLFDASQAEVLPRWEEAKGYEAPKEFRADRQVGPGHYTIKNTEVLQPRVTGGNFPRASRFGNGADGAGASKGRALKVRAGYASSREPDPKPPVPQLELAGDSGGGGDAEVLAASARISKSLNRAQQVMVQ
jgi:hypothetical protein